MVVVAVSELDCETCAELLQPAKPVHSFFCFTSALWSILCSVFAIVMNQFLHRLNLCWRLLVVLCCVVVDNPEDNNIPMTPMIAMVR
jgi:hypothetical protein